MTAPSAQDIAQWVAAGDLDGELMTIIEAVQGRFIESASAVRWVIELDDLKITEDDLTLEEAFRIERAAGCNWSEIEPVRSAAHCRAILQVCLGERLSLSDEQVDQRLSSMKVADLLRAIKREEVNPPPLASAD